MLVGKLGESLLGGLSGQPLVQDRLGLHPAGFPFLLGPGHVALVILGTALRDDQDVAHAVDQPRVLGDAAVLQVLLMLLEVFLQRLVVDPALGLIVHLLKVQVAVVVDLHVLGVIFIGAAAAHVALEHGVDGGKAALHRRLGQGGPETVQVLLHLLAEGHPLLPGHQGHGLILVPAGKGLGQEILLPGTAKIPIVLLIKGLGIVQALVDGVIAVVVEKIVHVHPVVDLELAVGQLFRAYRGHHLLVPLHGLFVGGAVGGLIKHIVLRRVEQGAGHGPAFTEALHIAGHPPDPHRAHQQRQGRCCGQGHLGPGGQLAQPALLYLLAAGGAYALPFFQDGLAVFTLHRVLFLRRRRSIVGQVYHARRTNARA